jgi:hypothetical protein
MNPTKTEFQPIDSHISTTEHNMMIPDQQVFDK